ncbi:MAG: type IX secretion system membrane protein PorP/SprF, partial [Flavitalea sp.]
INKAYTDDAKSPEFKLKYAYGIQGGYTFITPMQDAVSFHTSLNWQGKAYKHFGNIAYFKSIPSVKGGVGFGLGYRYDDAVVPNVEIRYSKAIVSLGYDVNVSPISAAGFRRNGIELAVKFDF